AAMRRRRTIRNCPPWRYLVLLNPGVLVAARSPDRPVRPCPCAWPDVTYFADDYRSGRAAAGRPRRPADAICQPVRITTPAAPPGLDREAPLGEGLQLVEAGLDGPLRGPDVELGPGGRLVGGAHAGEVLDFARPRLAVEAFRVPRLADLQGRVDVDLVEVPAVALADAVAVGAVGRDEGGDDDHAGLGEERGHLADPADVLGAVGGREAE